MDIYAVKAAKIFDGEDWRENAVLIVRDGMIGDIVAAPQVPSDVHVDDVGEGFLAPGFVDLQVNGGGGVMVNDRQDAETLRTICAAHARFGTTALLATLITDMPGVTRAAIAAGADALRADIPGFLGLHLEGPHLSLARKGAHDPSLIRPMSDADEAEIMAAIEHVPVLLTTLAPESVTTGQVGALTRVGVTVSLGHSDTDYGTAARYAAAGARVVTHLFNAMSQITNREPGLAGAAIDIGGLSAGLIADGIHVDPAAIRIALRAKAGPGRIFLVTDAMATIGTDMTSFTLNGRRILRNDGRLTLEDGTLAGADLDMISAVRFMHRTIGLELAEALRMASAYPARAMGIDRTHGRLGKGARADIVHLTEDLEIRAVWIGGRRLVKAA